MPFTDPQPLVPFQNTGLKVLDTNSSHSLIFKVGSNLTAERTLTITTGDSDRTLTISGNPTLGDWLDQDVKTTGSPAFQALGLTHTAPYLTLHNTTEEDGDYGREGKIIFKGEQTGAEITTLGTIQISHDGTSDDQKGIFTLSLNDGTDGDTPTAMITVDALGNMGIGTPNPFNKLHIRYSEVPAADSSPDDILVIEKNANANFNMIGADNGGAYTIWSDSVRARGHMGYDFTNETLEIKTNGVSNRIFIASTGNVGINTGGPDRKLEVLDTANPQARLTHTDGTYYCDFQAESDGDLSIEPSGSNINIIDKNLLLGTTTGMEIGTAANQKIGFYGTTPVVQLAKASYNNWTALADLVNALVAIGLLDAA